MSLFYLSLMFHRSRLSGTCFKTELRSCFVFLFA